MGWPLRLAGRAPGFELGGLGSNPRGAAKRARSTGSDVMRKIPTPRNSSVGRAEVSYASSAAGSIPASATNLAGLAKWEGNGSWPRHEAVQSRQSVRACSSSVERRVPNPRQRGFNSFLARQNRSGRSQRDEIGLHRSCSCFATVGRTRLRAEAPPPAISA
jgi:hypothetical protein